ncbi:MAG: hypothetical protein ABI357_03870 [Granulicella sp.]
MPKLKILAACEKVIFDQDGPASLINLFQAMNYRLQDAPLPERAIAPNQWCVFTQWEHEPRDVGQEFTQIITVTAPDGSLFAKHEGTFQSNTSEHVQTRTKMQFTSLPVWQEGTVAIRAFLKGNDEELGSYNFEVKYLPKDEAIKIEG